jgi:hypothetical protein
MIALYILAVIWFAVPTLVGVALACAPQCTPHVAEESTYRVPMVPVMPCPSMATLQRIALAAPLHVVGACATIIRVLLPDADWS